MSQRRDLLKILAAGGIALPASRLFGAAAPASAAQVAAAPAAAIKPFGKILPAALRPDVRDARPFSVVRDFADPVLELKRVLREAAEIEHALMLQYVYGALSLKPAYESVAGYGAPGAGDLLGVAVEEMQHLGIVNRLLVTLGSAPQLSAHEFPFEPEIYPFAFHLEPLSRKSLAKYVYCEAPLGFFDHVDPNAPDAKFADLVKVALGPNKRPNFVGSLYAHAMEVAQEIARAREPGMPDMDPWLDSMHKIRVQGEDGHFQFFKSAFLGTHEGLAGKRDVWSLPPTDADYPSFAAPVNPTAYVGHEDQLSDPTAVALAWLGNLQYWTALALLDQHFRHNMPVYRELAVAHMMGPVLSLGRYLPTRGAALPFDPLNLPYSSGTDPADGLRLVAALLQEGQNVADAIEKSLPGDYPITLNRDTLTELQSVVTTETRRSR